jgi:hypothetical protein
MNRGRSLETSYKDESNPPSCSVHNTEFPKSKAILISSLTLHFYNQDVHESFDFFSKLLSLLNVIEDPFLIVRTLIFMYCPLYRVKSHNFLQNQYWDSNPVFPCSTQACLPLHSIDSACVILDFDNKQKPSSFRI